MNIGDIEKYLINYKFIDGVSKFKIINRFDGFSIFTIENRLGGDFSGKISNDCIEFYGCGDDAFYEPTLDGVKEMVSVAESQICNFYRFEFFNNQESIIFISQLLSLGILSEKDINEVITQVKGDRCDICKVRICSLKLEEPIIVNLK